MSIYAEKYADLDKAVLDFDPIVLNRFGRISLKLKFFCGFGNRKITVGVHAIPNGGEDQRCPLIANAFTYLRQHGKPVLPIPAPDSYSPDIFPCRAINKAVYLKPSLDAYNLKRQRNPTFHYDNAIFTPWGEVDLYGWYDGKHPIFTFRVRPRDSSQRVRCKEAELESVFRYLQEYKQGQDTPAWMEDWREPSKSAGYPKQAMLPTLRKHKYHGH